MVLTKLKINIPTKQQQVSKEEWKNIFNSTKNKYKSKCSFCNNKYKKMFCICGNNSNKLSTSNAVYCCTLCKMIFQCNNTYQKDFVLCWSTLSQNDIVIQSVDYIKKHNKVPSIKSIDPEAKKLDISLIEYIDLISNTTEFVNEMDNYKIFLTSYFNKTILVTNVHSQASMFIDDECSNLEHTEEEMTEIDDGFTEQYKYHLQKINFDDDLPLYEFSVNETLLFDSYFLNKVY